MNVDEQLSTTLDLVEAFTSSESLCKTLKYALIKGANDTVEPDKSRFSSVGGRLYASSPIDGAEAEYQFTVEATNPLGVKATRAVKVSFVTTCGPSPMSLT